MTRPTFQTFAPVPTLTVDEAAAALTAGCAPCEVSALTAADTALATIAPSNVTWSGPIGVEGLLTGDGRMIDPGALRWATLPIPLRWVDEDQQMGHAGAVVVGRILTLERREGGIIWGTGDIDMGLEEGREAARRMDAGTQQGVSMDLDEVSFEIRVARELLEREEAIMEEGPAEATEAEAEDSEGRVTVVSVAADDEVFVITDARIRAATNVPIPAFEPARITLDAPLSETGDGGGDPDAVAASATSNTPVVTSIVAASRYPVEPPAEWFNDPGLTEPTRLTVTRDGRVYGHLATWGTCHTGYPGQCVTPPSSESGYAYFRTGTVLTASGAEVPTGRITIDTLHAGGTLSAADTMAHYENTGRAVADVAAGEDSIGIWVAGALRPGTTDEQVRALRASPLSGDWRRIAGRFELIAALAVNVPGYPIPRPQGLVAGGQMRSLVAAGMLPPGLIRAPGTPGALSEDDLMYLRRLADRERREQEELNGEAAALANRARAASLMRRVAAVRSSRT